MLKATLDSQSDKPDRGYTIVLKLSIVRATLLSTIE
jgi:hypothetical protein